MADGIGPIANLLGRVDANGALLIAGDASTIAFPILAPDGTAGAPSYSFANESGMGLYRPFDGAMAWADAGAAQYLWSSDVARGFTLASAYPLGWSSGAATVVPDAFLYRDAANVIAMRNGVNVQTFRVYGTYTDVNNYERLVFRFSGGAQEVASEANGTGVGRSLRLTGGSSVLLRFNGATDAWRVTTSGGHFWAETDNTFDIGASVATRPRNLYVAGSANFQFGNGMTAVFGADTGASTLTNSVQKVARIGGVHFLTAEEPMSVFTTDSQAAQNILRIGGGSALMNADTDISFYTAANTTTVTGTLRWNIANDGTLQAGTDNSWDIGANGASRARDIYAARNLIAPNLFAGATASKITATGDGVFQFTNNAGTDVSRLNFGGATNSFPSIKRSGAGLIVRLADDSGNANIDASALRYSGAVANTVSGASLLFAAAPTISSGFGTSPTVPSNNGSGAFTINVGTGGTASAGVIALPAATTGWIVTVQNLTAQAANRASVRTCQTASTTTTATIQNQNVATGAATAWAASDVLSIIAMAY